ncbi:hypothetical protein RQP46_002333 [Phenoliferia psychrophenolica]
MSATFTQSFFLHVQDVGQSDQVYEIEPLKDTRAPFNSIGWFAHVTILPGAQVSYKLIWKKIDQAALSSIEQLSIQFGSPEMAAQTGLDAWGQVIEVTPDELKTPYGSGSSKEGRYYFEDHDGYETEVRIVWRLKTVHESAAAARSGGRALAAQNSVLLLSPTAINVRVVFPRDGGRELWASSSVLSTISPYFKMRFDSKELKIPSPTPPTSCDTTLPWKDLAFANSGPDDSDDDDDDALTEPLFLTSEPCEHPHYTIEIKGFTFTTYYAVLSWILSHHIDFIPRATNSPTHEEPSSTLPSPASPEHVYRLAHLLEIPELQTIALEEIRAQVTVATVVADVFSETSGKYPAVLDVLCKFMVKHRKEMKDIGIVEEIARMVTTTPWGGEVVAKAFAAML